MASDVTRQELAKIIGEKTLHISDTKQLVRSIAAYISGENRPIDVESLTRDVMRYRASQGYIEAVAISAHELTPVVIADVRSLLKEHFPDAKHISVDTRIDESLVGGVRIDLPSESLDLSVRGKLNLFKRLVAEERN